MKKIVLLFSSIMLFTACNSDEKISEWKSFSTVPSTQISETSLGALSLSHGELMDIVGDVCYENIGLYYCKSGKNGTLYRLQTDDSYNVHEIPHYGGAGQETGYMIRDKHVEVLLVSHPHAICNLNSYLFDESSMSLEGFPECGKKALLIHADEDFLILQTSYMHPEVGDSDGAQFARRVYQRRTPIDMTGCTVDTIDLRIK